MFVISIWLKGSHVHKVRTGCIATLKYKSVSVTLDFELKVRTVTDVRKTYDKDNLIWVL